jgi:hypothetical protein
LERLIPELLVEQFATDKFNFEDEDYVMLFDNY